MLSAACSGHQLSVERRLWFLRCGNLMHRHVSVGPLHGLDADVLSALDDRGYHLYRSGPNRHVHQHLLVG